MRTGPRATRELGGRSLLFAGLVAVAGARMAGAPHLTAAYAALDGVYNAASAWILFFAGISWPRAGVTAILAVAALFAASNAWTDRRQDEKAPQTR